MLIDILILIGKYFLYFLSGYLIVTSIGLLRPAARIKLDTEKIFQ